MFQNGSRRSNFESDSSPLSTNFEKPPANEITELLALTELQQRGKPQRGHVKDALVSDNEESDDEE